MAQITVGDVSEETVRRLKAQAEQNGRSFESEVRLLLDEAAKPTLDEIREELDRFRKERFGDRVLSDSSPLIREDRER